jgi:hypothetical protein
MNDFMIWNGRDKRIKNLSKEKCLLALISLKMIASIHPRAFTKILRLKSK